jgi:hypothetical protein
MVVLMKNKRHREITNLTGKMFQREEKTVGTIRLRGNGEVTII